MAIPQIYEMFFIIIYPTMFVLSWIPLSVFDGGFLHSVAREAHGMRLGLTIVMIISGAVIFLKRLWFYRCKVCKKLWAFKKQGTVLAGSEDISVLMEVKKKNLYGEVINTDEQYIPGKRKTYATAYNCKYCGEKKHMYRTRDSASV